jgi:hypothetical protein
MERFGNNSTVESTGSATREHHVQIPQSFIASDDECVFEFERTLEGSQCDLCVYNSVTYRPIAK